MSNDDDNNPPPPGKARRPRRARGDGSLYHMPDGRWRVSVDMGYQPNKRGELHRKRVDRIVTTEREARSVLRDLLKRKERGLVGSNQTVGQYLKWWLTDVAPSTRRPSTLLRYEVQIRKHLIPGLGHIKLEELKADQVHRFLQARLRDGYAPKTVLYMRAVLSAALEHARRWKLVEHNAASQVDPPPNRATHDKHALTRDEAKALLGAVQGDRMEAFYSVALSLGLRKGEICALRWSDIDLDAGTLLVDESLQRVGSLSFTTTKNAASTRVIRMPRAIMDALRAHRQRQRLEKARYADKWIENDLVFPTRYGTPTEPRNMNRHLNMVLEKAGLPHVTLHELRHSAGSLMLAQGVPMHIVSRVLGHSSIRVTNDIYTHPYHEDLQDAADRMDKLLGG